MEAVRIMLGVSGSSYGLYAGINKSLNNNMSFGKALSEKKEKYKKEQYNDIFEHEQAHKSAAGNYGGSIVIEYDANGMPIGGHVNVKMPVLDKSNPDKTIKHADTIIKSALAPKDPSGQDYKVASEAKNIKTQAQNKKQQNSFNTKDQKNLNFMA